MRPLHRSLLALLLCLILPLQAGAAIARSVSVMTHGGSMPQPASSHAIHEMQAAGPSVQHAPDSHHHPHPSGHSADHAVTHASGADHAFHSQHLQDPEDHQHQKGDCQSCAKCCLMVVAAPPPVDIPPPSVAVSRVLQLPARTAFTTRFPDGPERPPRPLAA